jgi:hypothetical protein
MAIYVRIPKTSPPVNPTAITPGPKAKAAPRTQLLSTSGLSSETEAVARALNTPRITLEVIGKAIGTSRFALEKYRNGQRTPPRMPCAMTDRPWSGVFVPPEP